MSAVASSDARVCALIETSHRHTANDSWITGAPGSFDAAPFTVGSSQITDGLRSLEPTDLDDDGHQDIVAASEGSNTLTVFFGTRQ